MPNALLQHYAGKRAEIEGQIETITSLAFNRDDRTLTEQDREQLAVLQTSLADVTRDMEQIAQRSDLSQRATDALNANAISRDYAGHQYRDVGSVLYDLIHRNDDDAAAYRWQSFQERAQQRPEQQRAAQHMGTKAANTTPTAGGFDGLIVNPVRGPIVDLSPQGSPFLTLLNPQDLVAPGPFMRPRIVDPNYLTAAGPQSGSKEKGELPSVKWDYANDLVTPKTVGNYINLSLQAQTWVPQALQAVYDRLRARTEINLEYAAVAEAAKTTKKVTLAAGADAKAIQAAVWDAMAWVFTTTGQPATWLTAGPLGVSMLGSTVDLANRPLFPVLGPNNALGSANAGQVIAPFGLQFVQTPAITDTTIYVGNGVGLEAYVYRYPVLEAIEPSILGKQIAAAADVGFFRPTTAEAGPSQTPPAKYEAIVKIAP